jgi:glycosyltransferase involved in cell wall biosynthesis
MKIAIDIRKIGKNSTGSEAVFYYLVKGLASQEKSKKYQFLLLTDDQPAKIREILKPLPKNFKTYRVTPTSKLLWTLYSLPKFLKKNSVDIYETEYIVPFFLTKSIKILTIIHDISFKINPNWITKKDGLILNRFIPLSIKRADAIMAVSNFTKDEIVREYHCPEEKISVAYPAVDSRYFHFLSQKKAKHEVKEILGGDFPFLFHVSSLQPRKNVPLIISAFGKAKKKFKKNSPWKKLKLVIVGDKKAHNFDEKIEAEIVRQVRTGNVELGDILITGYQPLEKLPILYQAAEIFIFPSAYEGFGIPLVESMACGTPVVASDIPVFRELAENAITYVDIGKKNKVEKMAEAIQKLLENQSFRAEKIKLGQDRAKMFNWSQLASRTLEIYTRLAK